MRDTRRYVARTPDQVWAEAVVWYAQIPPHNLDVHEKVHLAHILGWEHYAPLCPACKPSPPVPNQPGSVRHTREEAPCLTPSPA